MKMFNSYLSDRPRAEFRPGRGGFVVTYHDLDEDLLIKIRDYQRALSASRRWTSKLEVSPMKETCELHVFPVGDLPQALMSLLQRRPGYRAV